MRLNQRNMIFYFCLHEAWCMIPRDMLPVAVSKKKEYFFKKKWKNVGKWAKFDEIHTLKKK